MFVVGYVTEPDDTLCKENDIVDFGMTVEELEAEETEENLMSLSVTEETESLQNQESNRYDFVADDTFDNILQVTAHHETLMNFYYMDENNKVDCALVS